MMDDDSSLIRRKRIEQLKERKASLEASRSILRERSHGPETPKKSTMQPTSRMTVRIPVSSNDKESGGVKRQEYTSRLPDKGSSRSNDSDEKASATKASIGVEPSFERHPTRVASLGMSSVDDSQDGYMTDDSGIGRQTVKKYKEYLQQDFQDEGETQQMASDRIGNRSENARNSYDKYYSQLSKETTINKWAVLKKKIGAPPSLEFNHVQDNTIPKDSMNEEQLIEATLLTFTKPKMEQVKLKSKKIDSQDLGILAGMLSGDDSEVESGESGGLSSVVSGEDKQFVDYQSSDDDSNDVEEEKATAATPLISAPKTMEVKGTIREGGSETHLALTENVKNPAESEVETPITKDTGTHPGKTRPHLKNTKADQDYEGSSCNEEEPDRVDPFDSSVPRRHHEQSPSRQADRKYLVHSEKLRMNAGYDPLDGSSSHTEDNFSEVWEESVATETGTVFSRGNNPQILSFSAFPSRAKSHPEMAPSHDVTMSEQRSSVHSASESSSIDLMSERYFPALHSGISNMIEVSSTESDSTDEELDFDKLAGLEQYTVKDASVKAIPAHHFQTPESSKSQASPRIEENIRENIGDVNESKKARPDFQMEALKHHHRTDGVSGSGKSIAAPQLWTVQKDSRSAVPDFNDLDTESIADLEAPTEQDSYETGSADESHASFRAPRLGEPPESRKETSDEVTGTERLKRETIFASGGPRFMCRLWAGLVILALFVLPIYFFVFSGAGSEREIASLNISPTPALSTGPSRQPVTGPHMATTGPPTFVLAPVTGPSPTTALPTLTSMSLAPSFGASTDARPTTVRPTTPITMVPTEEGTTEAPPSTVRPSTSITLAPTFEATTEEPPSSTAKPTVTPEPTVEVTMGTLPVTVPTASPITLAPQSCGRPCRLRELLISVWPPLEDALGGVNTPQYSSLEWLANNADYESYSDDQLIQRFALATLYFSTAGGRWRKNDLWLSDTDECAWYSGSSSATCDPNGSFIRLHLNLNNVGGTLPSDIALLSNLIEIDFSTSGSQASLSGAIPTELGKLQKLTSLNLRGNGRLVHLLVPCSIHSDLTYLHFSPTSTGQYNSSGAGKLCRDDRP